MSAPPSKPGDTAGYSCDWCQAPATSSVPTHLYGVDFQLGEGGQFVRSCEAHRPQLERWSARGGADPGPGSSPRPRAPAPEPIPLFDPMEGLF